MNMVCDYDMMMMIMSIVTATLMDARGGGTRKRVTRLNLVDLAGSEKQASSGTVGNELKEATFINKSLLNLGIPPYHTLYDIHYMHDSSLDGHSCTIFTHMVYRLGNYSINRW